MKNEFKLIGGQNKGMRRRFRRALAAQSPCPGKIFEMVARGGRRIMQGQTRPGKIAPWATAHLTDERAKPYRGSGQTRLSTRLVCGVRVCF